MKHPEDASQAFFLVEVGGLGGGVTFIKWPGRIISNDGHYVAGRENIQLITSVE